MILVQGGLTYNDYSHKWGDAQETSEAYQVGWAELARTLRAQPAEAGTVYLVPAPRNITPLNICTSGVTDRV